MNKIWIRDVFDRASLLYGTGGCQYFDEFGRQLVDLAELSPEEKILDIATGKGAILFPASNRVGERGEAVGIDLSPSMLEETRKRNYLHQPRLFVMDAEKLSFPNHYFDVVFCGFALFFFTDLSSALKEFTRVLNPKGRIAVSTWGRTSSLTHWVLNRAEKLGALQQLKVETIDSADLLNQILTRAGFDQIRILEKEETFWHASPEEWWNSPWGHGNRSRFEQLAPSDLEALQREALQYVSNLTREGQVGEAVHAIFGIAKS